MSTLAGLVLIALALAYGVRVGSRAKAAGAGSRLSATAAGRAIRDGARRGRERAADMSAIWRTGGFPAARQITSGARRLGGRYARRVSDRADGTRPSPAGRAWQRVLTGPAGTLPRTVTRLPVASSPDGNGHDPPDELAARRTRPPAPVPPDPPPAANGRTPQPVTTSAVPAQSGASADLLTALQQVIGHAKAGGLQAKQRAVKTLAEAHEYFASQIGEFARYLSEPDAGYPSSIWEPLSAMAAHDKAAAMKAGESDSALSALSAMSVGDLAGSAVRAPHHRELNSDA